MKVQDPDVGDVLITKNRDRFIYSLIICERRDSPITPSNIKLCLSNLSKLIQKYGLESFRVARIGELTENLPKQIIKNAFIEDFRQFALTITSCHGTCSIPPPEKIPSILKELHSSLFGGHRGIGKTYRRVRERYWWKGMEKTVEELISSGSVCQEQKLIGICTKVPMVISDTPREVFSKVAIDTVGPLPTTPSNNRHILKMQCQLSEFCLAVLVPDIRAITIADALARHLIANFGVPKIILSDRGTSFESRLLEKLSNIFGFRLVTTTSFHPQGNASLERSHAMLGSYIRTKATEKQDWDGIVLFAMLEYNTFVHSSRGFSPFEMIYGHKARTIDKFPDETELEKYN